MEYIAGTETAIDQAREFTALVTGSATAPDARPPLTEARISEMEVFAAVNLDHESSALDRRSRDVLALAAEVERLTAALATARVAERWRQDRNDAIAEGSRVEIERRRLDGLLGVAWAEGAAMRDELARLRGELQSIADATPSLWEPDMRDQFQAWAQSRARDALTPIRSALDAGTVATWTREAPAEAGRYWVLTTVNNQPDQFEVRVESGRVLGGRGIRLYGPLVTPPDGWREALAALDATDPAGEPTP